MIDGSKTEVFVGKGLEAFQRGRLRQTTGLQVTQQFLDPLAGHLLARIVHDGSSRNHAVASRDGRAEAGDPEAYLKQYVEGASGEPARLHAGRLHAGLSQQRIRDCSRNAHEECGLI